jgi:hypothetical protein
MGESNTQHTAAVKDSLDGASSQPSRKDKADSGSGGQASDSSRGLSLRNIVPYAMLVALLLVSLTLQIEYRLRKLVQRIFGREKLILMWKTLRHINARHHLLQTR